MWQLDHMYLSRDFAIGRKALGLNSEPLGYWAFSRINAILAIHTSTQASATVGFRIEQLD